MLKNRSRSAPSSPSLSSKHPQLTSTDLELPPPILVKSTGSGIIQTRQGRSHVKVTPKSPIQIRPGDNVTLVVDENRFIVDPQVLSKQPDTMLGRMFQVSSLENSLVKHNNRGEIELGDGISAAIFKCILEYYNHGFIRVPANVDVRELRDACDYFLVPFDEITIKAFDLGTFMHELSNDGARHQFENFLSELLMPAMTLFAMKGERECHVVIMMDDDSVEWDHDYPPQIGEELTRS